MIIEYLRCPKVPDGMSIEIEAEFDREEHARHPAFDRKDDGSLMNFGVEYISNKPLDSTGLKKAVDELMHNPKFQKGYIETERTSTHVHVNVQHWTPEELDVFLTVYYLIEPLLFNFTGKTRKSNLFCLPLYEAEGVNRVFEYIVQRRYNDLRLVFDKNKYSALNVASIGRIGTVEFRHMLGTNKPQRVCQWIDIVESVVKARHMFQTPKEVFNRFTRDRRTFVEEVFGRNIRLVDDVDWWEQVDMNFSNVFYFINLPEELAIKPKEKKNYRFKTEEEEDDLKYNGF